MPKLTAEASLYRTRTQYSTNITTLLGTNANIAPQLIKGIGVISGNKELDSICGQIADLINEALAEDHDTGIEILTSAVNSKSCVYWQ
jgi:hypothetical protein